MSISMKYIENGITITTNFKTINDLFFSENYDKAIFIDICDTNETEYKIPLPSSLQVLKCNKNKFRSLPEMPASLRNLYATSNRLKVIPNISKCTELEVLDLTDNEIEEITGFIPPSVRTLGLGFNKIRNINYSVIPSEAHTVLSYNFITVSPPRDKSSRIQFDHNEIRTRAIGNVTAVNDIFETEIVPEERKLNIYNDSQNVHNNHINKTVNASLEYIINYHPKYTSSNDFLSDIIVKYCIFMKKSKNDVIESKDDDIKPKKRNAFIQIFYDLFDIKSTNEFNIIKIAHSPTGKFIESWCNMQQIHSIHGITFKELLKHVWEIIQDHEHRAMLEEILFQELNASQGVCFTGRFNRVINVLSGFVDEVHVGISDKEQMQNQIIMAIRKARDVYGDDTDEYRYRAREEVGKILDSFDIMDEKSRNDWLDSI
jgi:hypothetical protein